MSDPDLSPEARAQAASAAMHARDRAAHALGIAVTEAAPGRATLRMRVRDDMLNGHDMAHGGMVFCLADTAFAHACNSYGEVAVAGAASIEFLKSVGAGEELVARAAERARGRRSGLYDVEVRNAAGDLVALFRGRSFTTGGRVASTGSRVDSAGANLGPSSV